MRKIMLSVVATLFCAIGYAQELPQIAPVSPEASSLGKYGEIPVNLSTGKINYTIPIYTINVKGFEWPIYLSYNYNGLMVDTDPPMTGLGWDLMSGGRITREVRGLPDERGTSDSFKKNHVVPYLEWDYSVSDYPTSNLYDLYRNVSNKIFDGQEDKYHINAGSLSGSFVFDEDNQVVFMNHRNYQVQTTSNGITVIDENGIKYFFNQKELGTYTIQDDAEITIPVSYLLTQVKLPNNQGEINFEYNLATSYVKTVVSETEITGFGLPTEFNVNHSNNTINNTPLKKITFPNGEVQFGITQATDGSIATNALNSIKIRNNHKDVLTYNLSYSNASRSLKTLQTITKSNDGKTLPFYSFEYHSYPHSIDYRKQDYWGFFNNKSSSNLISGNREIDFNETRSGALKTIYYPTGGRTEIVYEQNRTIDYDNNSNSNCSYSHNKSITGELIGNSIAKNIDTIITVPSNQIVKVYAYARVGNGASTNMFGAEASIKVNTIGGLSSCNYNSINISLSKNGEDVECTNEPGASPCPESVTVNDTQTGYTEDRQIHIRGTVVAPQNKLAKIYYKIDYEERVNGDKYLGGIRVAQTKDCEENNCITTDYEYIQANGTSSGKVLGAQAIFKYTIDYQSLPFSGGVWNGVKTYKSARSMQGFTSYQGAPVLYSRVELIKNGGVNGKVVKYFSAFTNSGTSSSNPYISRENSDWKSGKLLKEELYQKQGSLYTLQKDTENLYEEFFPFGKARASTQKAYNLAVARSKYRYTGLGSLSGLIEGDSKDYREMSTIEYPKVYLPVKIVTKEYRNGKVIVNTTENTYSVPKLQLAEQKIVNSSNQVLKTVNTYPTSGVLFNENRIAVPINVKTYKENSELSEQNSIYKSYSGLYLLEKVQTSKGIKALEDRVTYHSYDSKGNPTEVSKKDGTRIVYIWGYQQTQPIAQIEGVSLSAISSGTIADLQTKSNLDTSVASENTLRTALNNLRSAPALSNAQVTTFTYNPLVGVTSITDPRGETTYYEYDSFNRLEFVKDANKKILKEYKYNYKN